MADGTEVTVQAKIDEGRTCAKELTTTIRIWQPIRKSTITNCEGAVSELHSIWNKAFYGRLTLVGAPLANVYDRWRAKGVMEEVIKKLKADETTTNEVIEKFNALFEICVELKQRRWHGLEAEHLFVYILHNKDSVNLTEASIDELRDVLESTTGVFTETSVQLVRSFNELSEAIQQKIQDLMVILLIIFDILFRLAGGAAKNAIKRLEEIIPELQKGERNITDILDL